MAGLSAEVARQAVDVAQLWEMLADRAGAAAAADRRARQTEARLAAARVELACLRKDLAAVREELVWAFAERKLSAAARAPVRDLRSANATTA